MPFKIVRNDITKMNTEAIVNTANDYPTVGTGCDSAICKAAGYDELLKYRQDKIGFVKEGNVFITPGFNLKAKYIIHAVSPLYIDGEHGEEANLRSCYRKSLELARDKGIESISFPLISTGSFGYPKEEGIRIAVDEFNSFLLNNDMLIYLVVFDTKSTLLGEKLYPSLEAYIDHNYVNAARKQEYDDENFNSFRETDPRYASYADERFRMEERLARNSRDMVFGAARIDIDNVWEDEEEDFLSSWDETIEELDEKLKERTAHKSDTFSQYLIHLINVKGLTNVEVYTRAYVSKKTFSKIKNNIDYHPDKITALCLCVGAMLNLDETKDLLARAGYALSPSDLTDIIFSFFIEMEHYDVLDIDIKIEEYGLNPIIS